MSQENQLAVEKAVQTYQCGYNCAQTVLLTLFEQIKPKSKNDVIPKIAAGFGGGMGRCGSVCGALTGSLMVVGIKYGSNEPGAEKQAKVYAYANKLYRQFEKRHGTVCCRDLIKFDLSNPEEAAKARQEKVFEKICVNLIKASVTGFLELEK